MNDLKNINEDKYSALVKLFNHMESIKHTSKINKSLILEINNDSKTILKELNKISKKLNKN